MTLLLWYDHGTLMVRLCNAHGTITVRLRYYHAMLTVRSQYAHVRCRYSYGTTTVRLWYDHGTLMVRSCNADGTIMVRSRYYHSTITVRICMWPYRALTVIAAVDTPVHTDDPILTGKWPPLHVPNSPLRGRGERGGSLWQATAWKVERKTRGRCKLWEREQLDPEYGSIQFIRNIGNFSSSQGLTPGKTCTSSAAPLTVGVSVRTVCDRTLTYLRYGRTAAETGKIVGAHSGNLQPCGQSRKWRGVAVRAVCEWITVKALRDFKTI